jgi:hypothetical protein
MVDLESELGSIFDSFEKSAAPSKPDSSAVDDISDRLVDKYEDGSRNCDGNELSDLALELQEDEGYAVVDIEAGFAQAGELLHEHAEELRDEADGAERAADEISTFNVRACLGEPDPPKVVSLVDAARQRLKAKGLADEEIEAIVSKLA